MFNDSDIICFSGLLVSPDRSYNFTNSSFVRPSVHPFVRSFIRLLVLWFVCPSVRPSVRLLVDSFYQSGFISFSKFFA